MTASIRSLSEAVVARLRDNLPNVRSVEIHGGTFDLEEVRRISATAPSVWLAAAGVGKSRRNSAGQIELPVNFAAVIVTKDTAQQGVGRVRRDQAAEALATACMMLIDRSRFGLSGVGAPEDLRATNEFSGEVDKAGVALWQVTWTQAIGFGEDFEPAVAALSKLWVNEEEFGPGVEPPNEHPLAAPFEPEPLLPSPGFPREGEQ